MFSRFEVFDDKKQEMIVFLNADEAAKFMGCDVVEFAYSKTMPNMFSGKIETYSKRGEMPEGFWCLLRYSGDEFYKEISRRPPRTLRTTGNQ